MVNSGFLLYYLAEESQNNRFADRSPLEFRYSLCGTSGRAHLFIGLYKGHNGWLRTDSYIRKSVLPQHDAITPMKPFAVKTSAPINNLNQNGVHVPLMLRDIDMPQVFNLFVWLIRPRITHGLYLSQSIYTVFTSCQLSTQYPQVRFQCLTCNLPLYIITSAFGVISSLTHRFSEQA